MTTKPKPCPGGCEHTDAEHRAWDRGFKAGQMGKEIEDNPYRQYSLADAWEHGRSCGVEDDA